MAPTFRLVPRRSTFLYEELTPEWWVLWLVHSLRWETGTFIVDLEPALCLTSVLKVASCAVPDIPEPHVHMEIPFQRFQIFPALMAILREREWLHVRHKSKMFADISLLLKLQAKAPNSQLEWYTDLFCILLPLPPDRSNYRFPCSQSFSSFSELIWFQAAARN